LWRDAKRTIISHVCKKKQEFMCAKRLRSRKIEPNNV
jgi:hypothetical protein